jgi:WD40 repeat protein
MVMAIKLVHHHNSKSILVLAGYEGGLTAVHQLPCGHSSNVETAKLVYLSQPHTQPILAIDICPDVSTYFTSSADAVIAAHRIPELSSSAERSKEKLATVDESAEGVCGPAVAAEGLQDEVVAPKAAPSTGDRLSPSDQVVGSDLTSEVQPVSFRKQTVRTTQAAVSRSAGLSSLLSSATPQSGPLSPPTALLAVTLQPPHKTINTKHAGQQSLRVRSDGRILVTGGWDSRIRIYSTKTLKEVAVMKWHKQGVYAVDFAEILEPGSLRRRDEAANEAEGEVVRGKTGLGRLQRQREEQLQLKHWVVAGAKDGKVSLWEVF